MRLIPAAFFGDFSRVTRWFARNWPSSAEKKPILSFPPKIASLAMLYHSLLKSAAKYVLSGNRVTRWDYFLPKKGACMLGFFLHGILSGHPEPFEKKFGHLLSGRR